MVSAFLLFQVQPVIAKIILPWFGGSAAVWTTCLLFFQMVLLLGYLYAHAVVRYLKPRTQMLLHGGLLLLSAAALPIYPRASWKPTGGEEPMFAILKLLTLSVGLPYFLLSTTGPLIQAWYARRFKGAMPYRLYALSNAGSMFALISYPALFEPVFGTHRQALIWSVGYVVFILLCGVHGVPIGHGRYGRARRRHRRGDEARPGAAVCPLARAAGLRLGAAAGHHQPSFAKRRRDSVPLGSAAEHLPAHASSSASKAAAGTGAIRICSFWPWRWRAWRLPTRWTPPARCPIKVLVPLFSMGLFTCCMVCHGELARLKPHPRYLTHFYLMISAGGAMGGLFVALFAPLVFRALYEFQIGLALCAILTLIVLHGDNEYSWFRQLLNPAPAAAGRRPRHDGRAHRLHVAGSAAPGDDADRRNSFRARTNRAASRTRWSSALMLMPRAGARSSARAAAGCAGSWRRWPRRLLVLVLIGYIAFHVRQLTADYRLTVRNFYGALRVRDSGPPTDFDSTRTLTHGTINHGEQFLNPDAAPPADHLLRSEYRRRHRHPGEGEGPRRFGWA